MRKWKQSIALLLLGAVIAGGCMMQGCGDTRRNDRTEQSSAENAWDESRAAEQTAESSAGGEESGEFAESSAAERTEPAGESRTSAPESSTLPANSSTLPAESSRTETQPSSDPVPATTVTPPALRKTYADYFRAALTDPVLFLDGSAVSTEITDYALVDLDGDSQKELLVEYDAHAGQVGLYERCFKVSGMIVEESEPYSVARRIACHVAADGNGLIIEEFFPMSGPYVCGRFLPLRNKYVRLAECGEDEAEYQELLRIEERNSGEAVRFYPVSDLTPLMEKVPDGFPVWD